MSKSKKIINKKKLDSETEIDIDSEIEDESIINSEINESIYDDDLDDDLDEELDNVENDNTDCLIEKIIDDDNELFDTFDDDNIKENEEQLLSKDERISPNRLTKYEMVRILGERTKQLTLGAKPLIKNYQSLNYDKIAEEELKLNMIPYKIKRNLPNKKYEIWTLDELQKEHLLYYLD